MDNKNRNNMQEEPQNENGWYLGIFYFNPKDRRIFPPKRFGIGFTVNFGNIYGLLFLLVVIGAIVFVKLMK